MKDCLFCRMARGEHPCQGLFENEKVLGFYDIAPLAKVHALFIHREHTPNITVMPFGHLRAVFEAIQEWAAKEEALKNGHRLVTNTGPHGGQTIFHTHFHVLGGEPLGGFGRSEMNSL